MVKLEEVEDESFAQQQPGDEGDWDTDDGTRFPPPSFLSLFPLPNDCTLPHQTHKLVANYAASLESDISSIGSASDDAPLSESLSDRITALADMIPPHTRLRLQKAASGASEWGWWGFTGLCKTSWLVTVSGLLLAFPFAIAQSEDQMLAMQEKQEQMQQGSNDVSATHTLGKGNGY